MESNKTVAKLVREAAAPFDSIEGADLDGLLDRIGDARVVLLGEATHGTSEFYAMRARISEQLIMRRGFDFVAVEADWPDAARVNEHVLSQRRSTHELTPFTRFPTWMWRNAEVATFVEWLRAYNAEQKDRGAGFHGLDLYSMFSSIAAILAYLDQVDPSAAELARHRYGTLMRWRDPVEYARAVLTGRQESAEGAVVAMLRDMLVRQLDYARKDGDRFFDAAQNARLVSDAERYYRAMFYGGAASWNLRDSHMFETLSQLLAFYGPEAKGIVWAHNSHVGDASATEMAARGEHNIGQLCRATFGDQAYIIGFGTDHGTVAAASNWGDPMQIMRVRPSRPGSYESLCHQTDVPAFALPLRHPQRDAVRDELLPERLERAIGVIYRPETERESHYFYAALPRQVDEYIWFDETRAVGPLLTPSAKSIDAPDTYPFGL